MQVSQFTTSFITFSCVIYMALNSQLHGDGTDGMNQCILCDWHEVDDNECLMTKGWGLLYYSVPLQAVVTRCQTSGYLRISGWLTECFYLNLDVLALSKVTPRLACKNEGPLFFYFQMC